ncbi:hypothetical protein SISNIDRAFT_549343 [Sistotremastrum niveocremeum HHB9708]|uniref:Uncharacterized protein n=1 Tax=Sistotremastrum niveocremeum HHB9708 TaxID=1314777 RepID=A0A164VGC5_9AGAM|nr:hypothetical protein SISNIDRAFT_549343 [Sistotremastrum niveocremeum HHB9708]
MFGPKSIPAMDMGIPAFKCESLSVFVSPGDSYTPQPPFYMMAYEVKGPTTSSFLGSDPKSLSWQINHAAGAQLLLYIVDAGGVPGGVAGSVYTIQTGSTSSCHSSSSTSPVEIRSAATTITTCNSLEFAFGGGTLPYTVTILVTNLSGPSVNLTLGPDDNEYTWIDTVDPAQAGVLLATVHDANGRYAASTGLISLDGGAESSCGQSSSSGQLPNVPPGSPLPGQLSIGTTPSSVSPAAPPATITITSSAGQAPVPTVPPGAPSSTVVVIVPAQGTSGPSTSTVIVPAGSPHPSSTTTAGSDAPFNGAVQSNHLSKSKIIIIAACAAVGGVIAILLLILLIIWCIRRQRNQERDRQSMIYINNPDNNGFAPAGVHMDRSISGASSNHPGSWNQGSTVGAPDPAAAIGIPKWGAKSSPPAPAAPAIAPPPAMERAAANTKSWKGSPGAV